MQQRRLTRPHPELPRVFVDATGWSARRLACGHDVVNQASDETLELLIETSREVRTAPF